MTEQTSFSFPDKDKGYFCSCCGLFVKRYRRSLNCNMALALCVLYREGIRDFVHLENLMTSKGYKRCGDASYLIHWKFLERLREDRKDGSSRNGKYKITGLGLLFVENKITAKESALIFNNKLEGFEGKEINIYDSLGKKFSYENLMHNNN
jgi:hypothetical protein